MDIILLNAILDRMVETNIIHDYVCEENSIGIDLAIKLYKSMEFVYIPVRL